MLGQSLKSGSGIMITSIKARLNSLARPCKEEWTGVMMECGVLVNLWPVGGPIAIYCSPGQVNILSQG